MRYTRESRKIATPHRAAFAANASRRPANWALPVVAGGALRFYCSSNKSHRRRLKYSPSAARSTAETLVRLARAVSRTSAAMSGGTSADKMVCLAAIALPSLNRAVKLAAVEERHTNSAIRAAVGRHPDRRDVATRTQLVDLCARQGQIRGGFASAKKPRLNNDDALYAFVLVFLFRRLRHRSAAKNKKGPQLRRPAA